MKLRMFAGPMWAGKTTRLLEGGTDGAAAVVHPADTRRGPRDLAFLLPGACRPFPWPEEGSLVRLLRELRDRRTETLLIDEAHFYCLPGGPSVRGLANVLSFAGDFGVREARIAGIFHDCYSQFAAFGIWRELVEEARACGWDAEFRLLSSLRPCGDCGAESPANYFSVPNAGAERVGEDYRTLCPVCAEAWLASGGGR